MRKFVTATEIKDMNEMFRAGLKIREIAELTGRHQSVVNRYKKLWKEEQLLEQTVVEPEKPEAEEEKTETGLENSDYAKAYLAGDPTVIRTVFDIKRNVQIRSAKTGILYEMDAVSKDKVMTITLPDGTKLNIELKLFEKFVDEGIDVYLEMRKTT